MHPDWDERVKRRLVEVADRAYDTHAAGPDSVRQRLAGRRGPRRITWGWYVAAVLLVLLLAVYRLPPAIPASQHPELPRLRQAAVLRSAGVAWAADGFPASVGGWSLLMVGGTDTLVGPSGRIVLTHLPLNTMLAPGPGGAFAAWTTSAGAFVWWHAGHQHRVAPPPGGEAMTWTAVMAPAAPVVAIEAYNTAIDAPGVSGYRGPIIWMNLAEDRVLRRLPVGRTGAVPVPVLFSGHGHHLLLSNGVLWDQAGQRLGRFAVPPSLATLADTLGPLRPDNLVDGGRILIANTTPGRSWTYYPLKGRATPINIADWFTPSGDAAGELSAPPWSAHQIVYAVPWSSNADGRGAILLEDARRRARLPARGQIVEAATITQSGDVRLLARSPGQPWLWLVNGAGDRLARILLPAHWSGRAWLAADSRVILLQQGNTVRIYEVP
jgi:hypothetical protein